MQRRPTMLMPAVAGTILALTLAGCGAGTAAPGAATAPSGRLIVKGVTGCDKGAPCDQTGTQVTSTVGAFDFAAPREAPGGGKGGAVTLTVTNGGDGATSVAVVSSKRADLVILQGARTVYRWSDGRMFSQIAFTESWLPGQTRPFSLEVPALQPGTYTAQFYFFGIPNGARTPVLTTQWVVG